MRGAAFTLVELVVVIGIILLVLGFAAPGVIGILRGKKVEQAAAALTDVLERTRMEAITKNAYLWVGISNVNSASGASKTPSGQDEIWLLSFRSKNGEKRLSDDQNAFVPVTSLKRVEGASVLSVDTLPAGAKQNKLESDKDFAAAVPSKKSLKWSGSGRSDELEFNKLVLFTPRGEALIEDGETAMPMPVTQLWLGLGRTFGGQVAPNEKDMAAVKISGLTGRVSTVRP